MPASGQLVFLGQKFSPEELYFCLLGKTHHFPPKAAQLGGTFPPHFDARQPQKMLPVSMWTDTLHLASIKNIPVSTRQKNCVTILPHHDDFRRRHGISSSMKSTFATSVLRRSPSPAHCLQPSCRLVWSNSCYLIQNCTISTMQILLHSGHHDRMRRSWEFGECKFIFIAINPHLLI